MAVLGNRHWRYTLEIYRDGVQGSAAETETHIWDVVAVDREHADLRVFSRAGETIRPLLDSYRVILVTLVVPKDPTHFHTHVHSGDTPGSVVGWGTAWATLGDAVADVSGSLGSRTAGQRVAMVTCEEAACWS